MKKPVIAIVGLTCCEGCRVAITDLGARILDLAQKVVIGDFSFIKEHPTEEQFDIAFIEGTPFLNVEHIVYLKKLRDRTKFLVAIGACACQGGIQKIKNYRDKIEVAKYVYGGTPWSQGQSPDNIENLDIKPISGYVKVDLEIPGCPINKEEFLVLVQKLLAGWTHIKIPQRPVCYECQIRQNPCLLQEGKPCMGPIMLGGCNAPCPSSGWACDGCRGPISEVHTGENLRKILQSQGLDENSINMILERYGERDQLEDIEIKQKKIKK